MPDMPGMSRSHTMTSKSASAARRAHALLAGLGREDVVLLLEDPLQERPHDGVIVDKQDPTVSPRRLWRTSARTSCAWSATRRARIVGVIRAPPQSRGQNPAGTRGREVAADNGHSVGKQRLQQRGEPRPEFILRHESVGAGFLTGATDGGRIVNGEDGDAHRVLRRAKSPTDLESVHPLHLKIEEQHIGPNSTNDIERLEPVSGLPNDDRADHPFDKRHEFPSKQIGIVGNDNAKRIDDGPASRSTARFDRYSHDATPFRRASDRSRPKCSSWWFADGRPCSPAVLDGALVGRFE